MGLELFIDPWASIRGQAIMFHFDYGVDLYKEDGTIQYNFENLKKGLPDKYGHLEERQRIQTQNDVKQLRDEQDMTDDQIIAKFQTEGTKELTEREMAKHDLEVMRKRRRDYHQKKREEKAARAQLKLQKQQDKLNKDNPDYVPQQEL